MYVYIKYLDDLCCTRSFQATRTKFRPQIGFFRWHDAEVQVGCEGQHGGHAPPGVGHESHRTWGVQINRTCRPGDTGPVIKWSRGFWKLLESLIYSCWIKVPRKCKQMDLGTRPVKVHTFKTCGRFRGVFHAPTAGVSWKVICLRGWLPKNVCDFNQSSSYGRDRISVSINQFWKRPLNQTSRFIYQPLWLETNQLLNQTYTSWSSKLRTRSSH